jgi:hypothetical protein
MTVKVVKAKVSGTTNQSCCFVVVVVVFVVVRYTQYRRNPILSENVSIIWLPIQSRFILEDQRTVRKRREYIGPVLGQVAAAVIAIGSIGEKDGSRGKVPASTFGKGTHQVAREFFIRSIAVIGHGQCQIQQGNRRQRLDCGSANKSRRP